MAWIYDLASPTIGGGGQMQTPWLSDIDAAGHDLNNAGAIRAHNGVYVYTPTSPVDLTGMLPGGLSYQTDFKDRWYVLKNGAETGLNAGSDLNWFRYDDAGHYLGNPFTMQRSTGYIGINMPSPSAPLHVKGPAGSAAIFCDTGFISSDGGYLSSSPSDNAFNAQNGGMHAAKGYTSDQGVYLKATAASASLNAPAATYGGLAYQGGSTFWYYNSSSLAWNTVDFSAIGGGPGGVDQSVQHKSGSTFRGDGFIKWDWPNQCLIIQAHTSVPPALPESSPGIHVVGGYVDADLGFNSLGTTYNVFQAITGGAIVAGIGITSSPTKGGYISFPPLNGGLTFPGALTLPTPFPDDRVLLWNSPTNGTTVPNTSYTLCCNAGIRSAGSFISSQNTPGAFTAATGGAALNLAVYLGAHDAGPPTVPPTTYGGIAWKSASTYWYWNGAGWAMLDFLAAASAAPGGFDQSLQYRKEPPTSGQFQGDGNLKWDYTAKILNVIGTAGQQGLYVQNAYAVADGGFQTSSTSANAIQAPSGGLTAKSALLTFLQVNTTVVSNASQVRITNQNQGDISFTAYNAGNQYVYFGSYVDTAGNNTCTGTQWFGVSIAGNFVYMQGWPNTTPGALVPNSKHMLSLDLLNGRVGVRQSAPAYVLDVTGDCNLSSGSVYRINGVPIGGGPDGVDQSVQHKNGTAFRGDSFLKWDWPNQTLRIAAKTGGASSPGITVTGGYIDADLGFNTLGTNYRSVSASAGGAFLGGVGIQSPNTTQGGYIDFAPLAGARSFPGALDSASFASGVHVLLWASVNNGTVSPVLGADAVLNCNAGINTPRWFISTSTDQGALSALNGGATVGLAIYLGAHDPGAPPAPAGTFGGIAWKSGSSYWYWNGGAWGSINLASTGAVPGGNNTDVQFNNSGTFGGTDNFAWNNSTRLLTINAINGTAGVTVAGGGYLQADGGLYVAVSTAYNSIQTPGGILSLQRLAVYPNFTPNLADISGALVQAVGQNNNLIMVVDAYDTGSTPGTVAGFVGRRAIGTPGGALSNLGNGTILLTIGGRGSTTAGFTGASNAAITFQTSEGWGLTANGAEMNFGVTANGQTGRVARMWLRNTGMLEVAGTTNLAGIQLNAGFMRADDQGFATTSFSLGAFTASNGGAMLGQACYLASRGAPTNPLGGFGGIGYASGASYWIWGGSGWLTFDFGNPSVGVLTASGTIQSSSSGITFQNSGGLNFQVNQAGTVSCMQLNISGVKCVGSDLIWVQTVQTPGHVYGGDFGILNSFIGGTADITISGVGTLHFVGGLFKNMT